jgi:hypothetical protein
MIDTQTILDHSQGSDQVAKGDSPSQEASANRPLITPRMLLARESQASSIIRKVGSIIKAIQEMSKATVRVLMRVEDIPHACALADAKVLEIQGDLAKIS